MTESTNFFDTYKNDLQKLHDRLEALTGNDKSIYYDYGINKVFRDYVDVLGFNKKQIEGHLLLLNEPTSIDIKNSYSLSELLEERNTASNWLVPRLYRKSALYIVGAAPKTFKSMSMYDLLYSVTESGVYLDCLPCATGKATVYQCEEGKPTIINRLYGRGFRKTSKASTEDRLRVIRSFNIKEDLGKLEQHLIEFNPELVVFDSLRGISFQLDVSENSVEFSKYIYALQRIFINYGKTGIIIHHKNKSPTAKGLASLSGSLSIGGASDGVILMSNEGGDARVRIETIPRDGQPIILIIKREKLEGNRWKFVLEEEVNVDPKTVITERKILRELSKVSPGYLDKASICKNLGIPSNDNNFNIALDRLLESDILDCQTHELPSGSETFEFSLPISSPWITQNDNEKASPRLLSLESQLADILVTLKSKKELIEFTKDWDDILKSAVWALLNMEEKDFIDRLLKQSKYAVDDELVLKNNPEQTVKVKSIEFDELKKLWMYKVVNAEDAEIDYFENELVEKETEVCQNP